MSVLRDLVEGMTPDPERIVRLARVQLILGNDPRKWRHEAWALTWRWYESVERGKPDYGVYAEDDYLADVWSCWAESSRATLLKTLPPRGLPPRGVLGDAIASKPPCVVDLGCGIGITTAVLKQLVPEADVVGTNVPGCAQYAVAERLGAKHGFCMVETPADVGARDALVFASEYFEHFERPVEHLFEVLDALDPSALIVNNSFTQPSIGHFPLYLYDGARLDGEAASRAFNTALRGRGYAQMSTALWNHRPAYWKRIW